MDNQNNNTTDPMQTPPAAPVGDPNQPVSTPTPTMPSDPVMPTPPAPEPEPTPMPGPAPVETPTPATPPASDPNMPGGSTPPPAGSMA